MKKISCLIVSVFLASCASTYQPPPEVQSLKQTMNPSQALNAINVALAKTPGLCSAQSNDVNLPPPKFTALSGDLLQYDVSVVTKIEAGNGSVLAAPTSATPGMVSSTLKKTTQYMPYGMTLTKLTKFRILADSENLACNPSRDAAVVVLSSEEKSPDPIAAQSVSISVSKPDLNMLVAALMVLSPQAKLVEGGSF